MTHIGTRTGSRAFATLAMLLATAATSALGAGLQLVDIQASTEQRVTAHSDFSDA